MTDLLSIFKLLLILCVFAVLSYCLVSLDQYLFNKATVQEHFTYID